MQTNSQERRRDLKKLIVTLLNFGKSAYSDNEKGKAVPLQACSGPEGSRNFEVCHPRCVYPFKYEAQTALFKDPVRTAL